MAEKRLVSTWEMLYKDNDGEGHVETLHKYNHTEQLSQEELQALLVRQAPPIRVTPTRRKRPETATRTMVFFGDTHHPFQNQRRIDLAMIAVRELMPDVVSFMGDDLDMSQFSTFEKRPEWAGSTQKGIDQVAELWARVRADIGSEGQIIAIQGNHDFRGERELRKYNQELMGLRRAGEELPALALEYLLRCDELGVEYVSGYPEAEYWYSDTLKGYHGRATSSASVIAKELLKETVNFVHGHGHRGELLFKTSRVGRTMRTIFGMQVGTFADMYEAPSGKLSKTERGQTLLQGQNWDSVLGVIFEHEDGSLDPHLIPIDDESIRLFGKEYKS